MQFTRSSYEGSPCWKLTGRRVWADAEWNTRWPYGTSLCIRFGSHPEIIRRPGFTLDVNAPAGEPSRLYLWGPERYYMIGLLSWHRFRETGRDTATVFGREVPLVRGGYVRRRPRPVRGQAWDWKQSAASDRWRWIVVTPADWRERWAAAHPAEAEAAGERLAEFRERIS